MRPIEMQGQGDWLAARVRGWARVESAAGGGFDAYARLLHPLSDSGLDGAPGRRRWADVAADAGKVMHPLVQWGRLTSPPDPYASGSSVGWLDPVVLAELVPLLRSWTSTPDEVIAAFWEGWGGHGISSDASLSLPDRTYALLATSLDELADLDWGFQDSIGWTNGWRSPSVSMLWPEDRRWVLATEIDWDSTIVAGERGLVDALLADERYEVFDVAADADLSWHGDTIN